MDSFVFCSSELTLMYRATRSAPALSPRPFLLGIVSLLPDQLRWVQAKGLGQLADRAKVWFHPPVLDSTYGWYAQLSTGRQILLGEQRLFPSLF